MPVYQFWCRDCAEPTEVSTPYDERPETVPCSLCSGATRRQFNAPAVKLRGRGWATHPERDVANRRKGPQPKGADINERRYLGE
jgi:putative FmdB family regulatory protein